MFVDLIIFPTDFNLCVCVGVCLSVGTLNTLISKMSCKSADHQLCKVYIGSSDNDTTVIATRITFPYLFRLFVNLLS